MAEWLARSIGSDCNIREGRLPHVSEERTLPQSLFPVRLHPHHAILEKQFHMWAKSFLGSSAKDIEQMQHRGIASLPCYLWPTTREPQRCLTLIKLMHWFTLVDEAVDEGAGLHGDVLEVERLCKGLIQALQLGSVTHMTSSASDQSYDPTDVPADAAAANALHDLQAPLNLVHEYTKSKPEAVQQLVVTVGCQWWGEVRRANMPREKEARLAGEVSRYLMAQVDVTGFRENLLKSRVPPGVEEYIISRRVASAFPLGLAMVEYDMSDRIHQLDEETLNSPILQQLRDAVSDQASWLNDIISFPKEFRQGDFLSLLPLLHIRNNAHLRDPTSDEVVPFRVAVAQAWEMVAARERDCARLAHQILDSPHLATKHGLEEYVETVCGFTSGNWAWSIECPAYNIAHADKKIMGSAPDLQASPGRKLHGPSTSCSPAAPSQKMKIRLGSADVQTSSGGLRPLNGIKPSACIAMIRRCRQQTTPMMMMMKTGSREAPRLIKLHPSLVLSTI